MPALYFGMKNPAAEGSRGWFLPESLMALGLFNEI